MIKRQTYAFEYIPLEILKYISNGVNWCFGVQVVLPDSCWQNGVQVEAQDLVHDVTSIRTLWIIYEIYPL